MKVCPACGQEFSGNKKMCDVCIDQLISNTWKRQMRIYSMMMIIGMAMLVYDYIQFTGHHYGLGDAPVFLIVMMVLGGLGLMGGVFGLGLAVFFNIWHARANS